MVWVHINGRDIFVVKDREKISYGDALKFFARFDVTREELKNHIPNISEIDEESKEIYFYSLDAKIGYDEQKESIVQLSGKYEFFRNIKTKGYNRLIPENNERNLSLIKKL